MQVVIVGAGGHGKVVLEILRAAGRHEPVGFVDSAPALAGKMVAGLPVLGPGNVLPKLRQQNIRGAIIAIGDARARILYASLLREQGFELVNAIHPSASISPSAVTGNNVVIAALAAVCTESRIADSVILNTSCVIDHECEVGEATHVCPGAHLAGRVRTGPRAWIGMGANLIQCISVGEQATVGAGAVVICDVPAHSTVVGVPARVIKSGGPADPNPLDINSDPM
jgi:UDP-perosamine 4-acetyltransferase